VQELRGGGRQAGLNNGLVLLFECTEDFGLVRSLLSGHSADIWSDTVKGVGCIDHFVRQADIQAAYCPPYYKYAVGEEGQWVTTLHRRGKALKIDAASRGEMVYNILEDVLDQCPTYDTFLRWYCYPSQGDTAANMARDLELGRQLLALQTHVDRQLFNARVQCVLEVVSIGSTDKPVHPAVPAVNVRRALCFHCASIFRVSYSLALPDLTSPGRGLETFLAVRAPRVPAGQSSTILLKPCNLMPKQIPSMNDLRLCVILPGSMLTRATCSRESTRPAASWRAGSPAPVWPARPSAGLSASASTSTTSRTASGPTPTTRSPPTSSFRI
jgi:hypothetical protein